ncbi:MAG: hypothetical protein R3349_02365, partial [Geminicoccaceae bacterium]|nr:hypothetical protein [Geminicoccaceae bacterium]
MIRRILQSNEVVMTRGSPARRSFAQLTWPFAVLVMLLLVGCQSAGEPSAPVAAWRVLEQTGETRASSRSSERWLSLAGGDAVQPSSVVVTGPASRVILARGEDRVRLGPSTRVVLPAGGAALVEQQMGVVSYRVAGEPGRVVRIGTPHGDAESRQGVFQINVGPSLDWTTFEVSKGALRVATADGTRGVTIRSGQHAEARGPDGTRLAFRRSADAPLEAVAPSAVPVEPDAIAAMASQPRVAVARVAPERHPAARSAPEARPPSPSMSRAPTVDPADRKASGAGGTPIERIILPATFEADVVEAPASSEGEAAPLTGQSQEPTDGFRALTDGLVQGLER